MFTLQKKITTKTNNDTNTGIEFDSREISTNSNATDATSTATATTTVK